MSLRLNRRGDTIIEVLLCIAIVGLAVTGAYAISSHSLEEGVSASERTTANKIASSQIEALKLREKDSTVTWARAYGPTLPADQQGFANIPSNASFCLDTSALTEVNYATATPSVNSAWLPQANNGAPDDENLQIGPSDYNANCVVSSKYYISISANGNPIAGEEDEVYLVVVRWQPPGGGPVNQSQLYYRLPQSS